MSQIQSILESLADYLEKSDEYFNKQFYFDLSQINPNTTMPCMCFQVETTSEDYEQAGLNPDCRTLTKQVSILSCIDIIESSKAIKELWDYEELLIKSIRKVLPCEIHEDLMSINYVSSTPLDSLWIHTTDKNEDECFCNSLTVTFDLEYAI